MPENWTACPFTNSGGNTCQGAKRCLRGASNCISPNATYNSAFVENTEKTSMTTDSTPSFPLAPATSE